MSDTIEIEVTPSVREQYDDLVEEYGEAMVQTRLLQLVAGTLADSHEQLESGMVGEEVQV